MYGMGKREAEADWLVTTTGVRAGYCYSVSCIRLVLEWVSEVVRLDAERETIWSGKGRRRWDVGCRESLSARYIHTMGEESSERRSRGSALYQAHQARLGLGPAHSAVPGGVGEQEPEHSNSPYGAIAPYAEQSLDGAALLCESGPARDGRRDGRGRLLASYPAAPVDKRI